MLLGASGATEAAGSATAPTVHSIAGSTGGPGLATKVSVPTGPVVVTGGSVYESSGSVIWRIAESTDWLSTFAGGTSTANGVAANNAVLAVSGMSTDGYGNLLLDESRANLVRIIALHTGTFYGQSMTIDHVYTIAGDGTAGSVGDGGPATKAELSNPTSAVVDHTGNIVIGDSGNGRIQVVAAKTGKFYGQSMKTGDIYTVFRQSTIGTVAVDKWGNLIFVGRSATSTAISVELYPESSGTYYGKEMTAGVVTLIAAYQYAGGPNENILVDGAGNVLVPDLNSETNDGVFVIAAVSGTFYDQKMVAGNIYQIVGGGTSPPVNGEPALQSELFADTIALDESGNLILTWEGPNQVPSTWIVPYAAGTYFTQTMTAGDLYRVAGNGYRWYSPNGTPAELDQMGIASPMTVDRTTGNLVFFDGFNADIRVIAGTTGEFYSQQMTQGHVYTIAGTGQPNGGFYCVGGDALKTSLQNLDSIVVDGKGNVVFTDPARNTGGCVQVMAAHTGTYYGRQMTAGNLYILSGLKGDMASIDRHGNLVTSWNGIIYLMAVANGTYYGQPMTAGQVYQIAGGGPAGIWSGVPATQADLNGAPQTSFDAVDNIVIADGGNDMIRVISNQSGNYYGQAMKAGYIYRVAGHPAASGPPQNGIPAISTYLNHPQSAAVDAQGNLVIADTYNNEVRVVAEKNGTYYGQTVKAGYIYLLAGNKSGRVLSGLGGPAAKASIPDPLSVTVTANGDVLIPHYSAVSGGLILSIDG